LRPKATIVEPSGSRAQLRTGGVCTIPTATFGGRCDPRGPIPGIVAVIGNDHQDVDASAHR
jgi:hypothetical protein